MVNFDFNKNDLMELSDKELKNIDGGSKLSDAIWEGIGYGIGTVNNAISRWVNDPQRAALDGSD